MRVELERVLTLNKVWQAIRTVSIKQALNIVMRDQGRLIDPETYQIFTWDQWLAENSVPAHNKVDENKYLRTANLWVRKPEVITLAKFAGFPNRGLPYSRRGVYERDNGQCQFCGKFMGRMNMTIDHVLPVSKGGITEWKNCVLACRKCNASKADRTPAEAGMPLLSEPYRPTKSDLLLRGVKMLDSWKPFLKADQIEQHQEVNTGT